MSRRLPQPSAEATRRRLAGLLETSPDTAWEDTAAFDPDGPGRPGHDRTDRDRGQDADQAGVGLRGAARWRRETVLVVSVILLLGILLAGFTLLRSRPIAVPADAAATAGAAGLGLPMAGTPTAAASTAGTSGTPSARASIAAHVIGEVQRPGLVALPQGARVDDAITAAGGLTSRADPGDLNLAQPLQDGQQVVVGSAGRPGGEVRGPATASGTGTSGGGTGGDGQGVAARINLNTASAVELEELPGVGPATAKKIITWREQNGGFRTVEQLQDVQGIGPKTYADIAPRVVV
ncbi:helix-hairpin-helix domain-containing protein [Raineyella sp. LH-20]|uniref:helix-hairpin-helix domain-containing protein n=1 Tax=Raineyella sp. LH-20 TaxID=3081204 RepID=UPI002954D935|nr:helix-hairpin-helix domain-containing protein [Raineyella sp. LH-20]WOP17763.1 helix-hairpin-helix domain-containing protein [Raineyella sp. LH-20]